MAVDPEVLFAAHRHRLFKYFCRAVGRTETARDLTQDTFLRVSRTTIPVAADGEVRACLFQIARNLALDHHRKRLTHPEPSVLADRAARPPSQDVDLAVNEALAASVIHVKPEETVEIRLPKLVDSAGPFAKREFSVRIRARQLR